jgi:hypothetical protein
MAKYGKTLFTFLIYTEGQPQFFDFLLLKPERLLLQAYNITHKNTIKTLHTNIFL